MFASEADSDLLFFHISDEKHFIIAKSENAICGYIRFDFLHDSHTIIIEEIRVLNQAMKNDLTLKLLLKVVQANPSFYDLKFETVENTLDSLNELEVSDSILTLSFFMTAILPLLGFYILAM